MNDQYISTESLNKQLDEAYNKGIDDAIVVVEDFFRQEYGHIFFADSITLPLKELKK